MTEREIEVALQVLRAALDAENVTERRIALHGAIDALTIELQARKRQKAIRT